MHLRWRYKIIPSENEAEGVHLKAGNSNRLKKNLLICRKLIHEYFSIQRLKNNFVLILSVLLITSNI